MNADDFGLTAGVNRGIVEAFRRGIVTSTTLMANREGFDDAVRLAGENPGLGIGVHLVLVGGHSVAPPDEVSGLVDGDGALPASVSELQKRLLLGRIPRTSLEREVEAQIERIREAGIEPTHLDGHKHTHVIPAVAAAASAAAGRRGLRRVRIPLETRLSSRLGAAPSRRDWLDPLVTGARARFGRRFYERRGFVAPEQFLGMRFCGHLDSQGVIFLLGAASGASSELMCHPGRVDPALERISSFTWVREAELAALSDPEVVATFERLGLERATFADL